MWWKIYFWIFAILSILGLFTYLQFIPWNLGSWFEVITSLLAVLGSFAYIYQKKIFSPMFWKLFFWLVIINWVLALVYELTTLKTMFELPQLLQSQHEISPVGIVFGIILASPAIYAVYQLGQGKTFGKTSKKKKK